jgi:hypothetical protein
MYLTHTFAHRETLSRAHSWLTDLGFRPRRIDSPEVGIARLMIPVKPDCLAAAQMVINAVETADEDGFPSFWDETQAHHLSPVRTRPVGETTVPQYQPHSSVIGWHPLD